MVSAGNPLSLILGGGFSKGGNQQLRNEAEAIIAELFKICQPFWPATQTAQFCHNYSKSCLTVTALPPDQNVTFCD